MTEPSDPYATFLASADVATWRRCLDRAMARVTTPAAGDDRVLALTQAVCISLYLQWLGRVSGDAEAESHARQCYRELGATLHEISRSSQATPLDTCWGIVLGWSGYSRQGAELLQLHGPASVEHLLIVLQGDDVRALSALRPAFGAAEPRIFLPALHVYGSALVNVGAVDEARALVVSRGRDTAAPLLADVLGNAAERLGEWSDAYTHYSGSSWPAHRYRAALAAVIADREPGRLDLDQPMCRLIGQFEGELEQTEVARCTAFLNACLWRPARDWLVELELGRLCSRRRWYMEADAHYLRALASAPAVARFPIANLRFGNLTWVTGPDTASMLDVIPEVLTVGREGLALAADQNDASVIRVWLARQTGDLGLIPAELTGWDPHQRGEAYDVLGDEPLAVDAWLEGLASTYNHRSVIALMRRFRPAGCTHALAHLALLVLGESQNDFLALWETAQVLQEPQSVEGADTLGEDSGKRPDEAFRDRLLELSELEFKNAVRSYPLFARAGLQDLAEELLVRAGRAAESVSELVTVSVLCREGQAWRMGQVNPVGLRCLTRALNEARDRLERLEVARELFHYGQIRKGRDVLVSERVLTRDAGLSHIEAVAALQCGSWLGPDERETLASAAARRLLADHQSGALTPDAAVYADRLVAAVGGSDGMLAGHVQSLLGELRREGRRARAWSGSSVMDLTSIRQHVDAWLDNDAEPGDEADGLFPAAEPSFGLRLAVLSELGSILSDLRVRTASAVPPVAAEDTPIRMDPSGDGIRAIQLGDLWRRRLLGGGADEEVAAQLSDFLAEEVELTERWEQRRMEGIKDTTRRMLRVCQGLTWVLRCLLGPAERDHAHPVLRELYGAVARDVDQMLSEVAEATAGARRELALATTGNLEQ